MQSGKTQKTLVRDLRKKCNRSTIYVCRFINYENF